MIGAQLTYADFMMYEAIDFCRCLDEKCLDKFPKLKDFLKHFENLPKIKQYLESDRFRRYPLFGERTMLGRNGPGLPKDQKEHEQSVWKKEGEFLPM